MIAGESYFTAPSGLWTSIILDGDRSVAEDSTIIKINAIKELEPAIYQVTVTREDGWSDTMRMSIFELNRIKSALGLPVET